MLCFSLNHLSSMSPWFFCPSSSSLLPSFCPFFAFADSFHSCFSPALSDLLLSVLPSLNLPGACLLQRLLPHLNPVLFQHCSSLSITSFQCWLLFLSPGLWGTRVQSGRPQLAVAVAGYQGKSSMCGWKHQSIRWVKAGFGACVRPWLFLLLCTHRFVEAREFKSSHAGGLHLPVFAGMRGDDILVDSHCTPDFFFFF